MSIILLALAIADVLATRHFLSLGIREAKPIMRWAFDTLGFVPASAIKLALTALLAWWDTATSGQWPQCVRCRALSSSGIFIKFGDRSDQTQAG